MASLLTDKRLLLGSDAPFPLAEPNPPGRLDHLDWLTETDKQQIRAGNAAALIPGLGGSLTTT